MDPYFIFQLREQNLSSTNSKINETDNNGEIRDKNNILCILWRGNKLGAAYYSLADNLMYVYEEYIDPGPNFLILKYLYQEILPKYTVCIGTSTDIFIKAMIDTINDQSTNTTSSDIRSLPPNFFILSIKEYPYEICKAILQQVKIASYQELESTEVLKTLYMHSLINFDYKMSVYAAGALIKYLDKNWAHFSPEKEVHIMYIHQVTLKNQVLVDWNSFNAFQIFQQKSHEAGFKRGVQSNTREGMSIYKLFSSHCKSRIGQNSLRNILLNPTFDLRELNKRLDFIQFVQNPVHREFIESIQDNIKQLVDVNIILRKIQNSQAKSSCWQTLHKVISRTIMINELSGPLRHKSELLSELNKAITSELIGLDQSIKDAFDFSSRCKTGRPTIKFGIDVDLDAKKMQRQDISKNVTAAARVAVEELPDYLTECVVVYLPEMGHLVSVKEWEPNCDPEQLSDIGYKFMFSVGGSIHYKTALCVELDETFGDINAEIVAHENRLIQRVSAFVLKYNNDIREPLRLLAVIDSLIALAKAAAERNFVKPSLNNDKIQEIKKGRHPLIEEMSPGFVSNDFYSGGTHSHIKIITGANGSGKSIYLRQTGIIIYLAHLGSYVPAEYANIGIVHSIHFRTATESVSVRLSAFMLDVTQITQAIHCAKASSLIIMDEFGKGTSGEDGVTLMAGVLNRFLKENKNCPHVLVATHFQQITSYLRESPLLEYQKMAHTTNDEDMVLLFKIEKGVSESFTFEIAEEAGIDINIIKRAKEIYNCLKNNEIIKPLKSMKSKITPQNIPPENILDYLSNIEIPGEITEENNIHTYDDHYQDR